MTGALLLLLASCQNEDMLTDLSPMEGEITLQATIAPRTDVQTRASFDHEDHGKGNFDEGDQISVYITPQGGQTIKRTATLQGATWTFDGGKLTWAELQASKAVFSAYYPATDAPAGGTYSLKCETNQEFGGMLERSDKVLLCSSQFSAGQPVNLQFHHAMHFLEVNLSGSDNVSQNAINAGQVYVNAYPEVQIDLATGQFKQGLGAIKQIRMRNKFKGKFVAVLCPQPIQDEWRNEGWLKLNVKGMHTYKAPLAYDNGALFTQLESGKRFTLNLRLGADHEVVEDLTDKTKWVAGLHDLPRLTQWGIAYGNMGTIGLKYEPHYGWYDIKKLDPISPESGDHRLCWAATCSNMLHWWYDRNRENIACYLQYKQHVQPDYVVPTTQYDPMTHKHSDIFDFYKRTCTNVGGWVSQGLRWYLRGDWIVNDPAYGSTTKDVLESRTHRDQGGFFGDVYEEAAIEDIWQGQTYGANAGTFILNALNRGDVIGIDHQSMNGSHAITVWGATFDEKGEITHIYVCDNNHSEVEMHQGGDVMIPGKLGPFGMFQMRIKRDAPDSQNYHLQSSATGQFTVQITGLESLSQGKAAWDRFWKKHPDYAPRP